MRVMIICSWQEDFKWGIDNLQRKYFRSSLCKVKLAAIISTLYFVVLSLSIIPHLIHPKKKKIAWTNKVFQVSHYFFPKFEPHSPQPSPLTTTLTSSFNSLSSFSESKLQIQQHQKVQHPEDSILYSLHCSPSCPIWSKTQNNFSLFDMHGSLHSLHCSPV